MSSWYIILGSLLFIAGYLWGIYKTMDSKLSAQLTALAAATSALAAAANAFVQSAANSPLAASELDGVVTQLATAVSNINSVITVLTPATVTISDTGTTAAANISKLQPAPPSSTV